jgi:hypothetical protein
VADVFEVLTASESEQSIAKKAAADTLDAAIYDVRERFGEHLFIAKSKDEFHDRLALCKDDMMKTVNAHLMPVTGVMRRVCKTMEREWRERTANRPLHEIAKDIKANWPKVNYAAQPYLDALHELESVDDMYYQDPAKHIVNYFLANARTWRGPEAKRIKDELNGMVRSASRVAYSDEELDGYREMMTNDEKPPRPKAKPFPDTDGEWEGASGQKKADNTGPVQSLDQTYSPSDGPLVPEGDFHAYQNSVDQNAESTVSGNFTPGGDSGSDKHARRRYAEDVNVMPPGFNMPFNGVGSPDIITGMPSTNPGEGQYGVNAPAAVDAQMRGAARRRANEVMGYPATGDPAGMVTPPPAPGGMDPSTGGGMGAIPAPAGTGSSGPEVMTAAIIKRYAQWCVANLARPSVRTLEYYAANRPDLDYFVLTAALQKHAEPDALNPLDPTPFGSFGAPDPPVIQPGGAQGAWDQIKGTPGALQSTANRRSAAGKGKDYLMQADEAITNLLNEKAEEFQESIQPLQQALQTIQYAEQVQQAQNPMNVMPPAGTVNVLPQTEAPQGPAPQGVDPSGQVDPAMLAQLMGMGGGDPSQMQDPNAGIPPAAAEQGAVPPEMQMQARRRQASCKDCGGSGKHKLNVNGERVENGTNNFASSRPCSTCKGKESRRRRAKVDLSGVRIEDREAGLCSGTDPDGHRVMFQVSPEDIKDLLHVMQGDLAQNFSGVSVDEEDIVDHGGHHEARRRTAGDLKREYGFTTCDLCGYEIDPDDCGHYENPDDPEDRCRAGRYSSRRQASSTSELIAEYESTPHDTVMSFELEEAIHRLAEQGDPEALAFLNGHDEQSHDAEGHDYPPMGHMARRRTAMPMTEDGYVEGDGWIPGVDFDPHDSDEMEVMEHVWAQEKHDRMRQLEEENEMLRGIVHGKEGAVSELNYNDNEEPEEGWEENHRKVNKDNGWPEPPKRSKAANRGKARGAARPQSRGRTANGDLGHCQMGSGCGNQADLTLPLRILGDVPFCRPCAERYVTVKDRYRKEIQEKNRAQQKSGGIMEEWQKWQQRRSQSGKLGIGGDKDIEDFAAELGYGHRGVSQLRKYLYGQHTAEVNNGWYKVYEERKKQKSRDNNQRDRPRTPNYYDESKKRQKQAWSGWGPSQVKRTHAVDGWDWDKRLSAYVASSPPEHFVCKCGSKLAVPGYHNCKCGKIWNSYVIGTGGENRQAAVEKFLCREIAVRDNVIVATRKTAKDGGCTCWEGYERVPGTEPCASGSCRKKTSGRDTSASAPKFRNDSWKDRRMVIIRHAADEDDYATDDWPSDHHPGAGKSTMKKPPADWHHRDRGGKWTA